MHHCLDLRESTEGDSELNQHARQCESCRAQLEAWRQIAAVIPGRVHRPGPDNSRTGFSAAWYAVAAGLAAALLLPLILARGEKQAVTPMIADSTVAGEHQAVLAQATGDVDPAGWWRSVQDRDWVGQTMPAVRSVQEGVAPLGRSLMRAVTILTIGGREQTS
jgi:hypothetical protein